MRCVILAAMALALGGSLRAGPVGGSPVQNTAAPAPLRGDSQRGQVLFDRYGCASCHGGEAQGGFAGPRLGPNPLAFPAFVRYVRAPRGVMPPYSEKLLRSEQDLADIHAYLSTRAKATPLSALDQLGR